MCVVYVCVRYVCLCMCARVLFLYVCRCVSVCMCMCVMFFVVNAAKLNSVVNCLDVYMYLSELCG